LRVPAIARLKAIYAAAAGDVDIRLAAVWALARLQDRRLLADLAAALDDPELVVRCAAANGLRDLVVLESYESLRLAFEKADPSVFCPEKNVPVQEGGRTFRMVDQRNYMLVLLHGLASTDHPALLEWLVAHQDDTEDYITRTFMKTLWEDLKQKEADGKLNHLKRKLALDRAQKKALQEGPDAGPDAGTAPDGDPADGGR